jgi:UDP-GlcNAc:undecaprenyl-phosphate GlcNAc-1-phosphate transferase
MLVLLVFAVATAVAVAAGGVVRGLAPRIGAVVPPRPDRWHHAPTPTMGGVAIVLATAAGCLPAAFFPDILPWFDTWMPVPLAALTMFGIGMLDDRLQLSPTAKLVASLVVGALLVFILGRSQPGGLSGLTTLVSIVWFAGMCHALNLLDNMDGLAAGVAFIGAVFLALIFGNTLGAGLDVLLISFAGALLGFLYWNRSRARLFMGDSGSLFLGAILGGITLVPVFHAEGSPLEPALLAAMVLVVPLFDTGFVLVLRRLAGRSATRGGTDHVSHRLASLGFSERSAVRILYLAALIGGGTAYLLTAGGFGQMLPAAAVLAVVMILLGIYLARVPAYNAEDFIALQKSSFAPLLKDLAFRWHAGQVLLDLVLITACYYTAYRLRFEGESLDAFLPYFTSSLPVVLACKLAALYVSGLYQRSWETFGLRDLSVVARGVGLGSLLAILLEVYVYRLEGFSRVVFMLDGLLLAIAVIATRASFRSMNLFAATKSKRSNRVLIYGAGAFGQLLVREMRANAHWNMNPVAFIDDDGQKANTWIGGVPVRGAFGELERTMEKYGVDEVILSSPSVNGQVEHDIRALCARLDRPVRRFQMEIR